LYPKSCVENWNAFHVADNPGWIASLQGAVARIALAQPIRCSIATAASTAVSDVDVCAHIFSQAFLVASTSDCDSAESHVPRKLDTKMPKAANALLGDRQRAVDWLQRAVALEV